MEEMMDLEKVTHFHMALMCWFIPSHQSSLLPTFLIVPQSGATGVGSFTTSQDILAEFVRLYRSSHG